MYQTRHTFASLMLSAGEDPLWVARMLGHTSTEMLYRHYGKYIRNRMRKDGGPWEHPDTGGEGIHDNAAIDRGIQDFVAAAEQGRPAVLGQETVTDYGFYTQLLYGFRKGWVAGTRFDYVTGDMGDYERRRLSYNGEALGRDPLRNERWRVSPNLTWYPTEYSKLRLQYNYDDRRDIGVDHSVWLQFEFLLGAHAAHKF